MRAEKGFIINKWKLRIFNYIEMEIVFELKGFIV